MLVKRNYKKSTKFFGNSNINSFDFSIIFGSLILEWNEFSLCIPKIWNICEEHFLSFDIGDIPIEYIEDMFNIVKKLFYLFLYFSFKISPVIVSWNSQKQYSENLSGNSFNFVNEILKNMNIIYTIPVYVTNHLQMLKDNSLNSPISIEFSHNFRKKFKQRKKIIEFQNHLELDNFFSELIIIDKEFSQQYINEYNLLKSFDDAFTLKYFSGKFQIEILKKSDALKQRIYDLEKEIVKNDSFEIDLCPIQKWK